MEWMQRSLQVKVHWESRGAQRGVLLGGRQSEGSLEVMLKSSSGRYVGICQAVKRRERHPQQRGQAEQRLRGGHGGELPVVQVFGKMDEASGVMEPPTEGSNARSRSLDCIEDSWKLERLQAEKWSDLTSR